MMRALKWTATGITLMLLLYILHQPALAYFFNHNEEVPTATDWQPKMRTWIKGELQP